MNPGVNKVLGSVQGLNRRLQRLFWAPHTMAREYSAKDISRWFKPNGAVAPDNPVCLTNTRPSITRTRPTDSRTGASWSTAWSSIR